jgi:hypothetical protein
MTAFQAAELSYFYDLFSKEIERVRFYSDLAKELNGECWFRMTTSQGESDRVLVVLEYHIGTYYPERIFDDTDVDSDLLIQAERKESYFYIPSETTGIMEYENHYDRAYCTETITTITEFALDALKRIEAAMAAYEQTIAPYHKLPI